MYANVVVLLGILKSLQVLIINRAHPKPLLSQYSSLSIPVSFSCYYFDVCNSFSDGPKLLFSCCSNNIFIIRTGNHCLTLTLMLSMYFSDILLKCIILFVTGYGSNNSSSRTTHRNGTRMGSSIYIADEINTCYFNDSGLVWVRCKFLLNCFSM